MAEEKTTGNEREYVIPLRRSWSKVPRYRRAEKAIRTIKEFLARHMKVADRDLKKIKIDTYLNDEIWFRGIKKPPHKIKVKAVKEEDIVRAELSEYKDKLRFKKARAEKKEQKAEEAAKAKKAQAEEHKHEEVKEEKTEEEKKEESEKKAAAIEATQKMEKEAAKKQKHQTKQSKQPKHQQRKALQK